MAYADRISDLARTLAQYPTSVTITGSKIDIRTAKQLESLNAQISNDQSLARDGDTLIAAGSGKDAKALSQRIADGAPQVGNILAAFGAQDAERLKTLSIMSKQKFDASAASRLQAEKRFADEVAKLMMQESQAVAALESGGHIPAPKSDPTAEPKSEPEPHLEPQPAPEPSLSDVIADMPGYLQATYPQAVANFDQEELSALCTKAGTTAISLGAQTPGGVSDFVTASLLYGDDLDNQDWAKTILKDTEAGTMDDRMAILCNATESRLQVQSALALAISPTGTPPRDLRTSWQYIQSGLRPRRVTIHSIRCECR